MNFSAIWIVVLVAAGSICYRSRRHNHKNSLSNCAVTSRPDIGHLNTTTVSSRSTLSIASELRGHPCLA